ncbi:hypothetical protein P3G55_16280 [Leptospira sp. 96542]|nr:hypothetical protein [Leptospira sp. 96542]
MKNIIIFIPLIFLVSCLSSREKVIYALNPVNGKKTFLLGDFKQKSNYYSINFGKLTKDYIALALMNEGYRVDVLDTQFEVVEKNSEETKSAFQRLISKAAGEDIGQKLNVENLNADAIKNIAKNRNFDYFIQGKIHLIKDEFHSDSLLEIILTVTISNNSGDLIAVVSSDDLTSSQLSSESLQETVENLIKKLAMVKI